MDRRGELQHRLGWIDEEDGKSRMMARQGVIGKLEEKDDGWREKEEGSTDGWKDRDDGKTRSG